MRATSEQPKLRRDVVKASRAVGVSSRSGMTLVEILVVTVVLTLLVLTVLSSMARLRARVSQIKCANNLKNVGLAFRIFATDNEDFFPFQISTNQGGTIELTDVADQFRSLSNELSTPKILLCPPDYANGRRTDATNWASLQRQNISFFVGTDASETNAASILSGDSRFKVRGTNPPAGLSHFRATDSVVYPKKFHPEGDGANILLGDGSVHRIGSADMPKSLANSRVATNRFILP